MKFLLNVRAVGSPRVIRREWPERYAGGENLFLLTFAEGAAGHHAFVTRRVGSGISVVAFGAIAGHRPLRR
jgi:hypothetical protein